jgi:hypothetical protein
LAPAQVEARNKPISLALLPDHRAGHLKSVVRPFLRKVKDIDSQRTESAHNQPKLELKPISAAALSNAIEKAEHYRLLNEPMLAESICLDVLLTAPHNQRNLVCLILAVTDQFAAGVSTGAKARAREYIANLETDYQRAYYTGILAEREASAILAHAHANLFAYEHFREAMTWYEKAEALSPPGNEDAKLRYNTCVRWIERERLTPAPRDSELPLE